jgi:hypothetical protein
MLKDDAIIKIEFRPADIAKLQAILFKHMSKTINIDDASWDTILDLCQRIDDEASLQKQIISKEVNF